MKRLAHPVSRRRASPKRVACTLVAASRLEQKTENLILENQGVTEGQIGKNGVNPKPTWVQVNACTWKLAALDSVEVGRAHGKWSAFASPRALAWVFDIGRNDWRVRVRIRGKWRSLGAVVDLDTAKRLATRLTKSPLVARSAP